MKVDAAFITALAAGLVTLVNVFVRLRDRAMKKRKLEHDETEGHEDAEFRRITGGYGGLLEQMRTEIARLETSRTDCQEEVGDLRRQLNAAMFQIYKLKQDLAALASRVQEGVSNAQEG